MANISKITVNNNAYNIKDAAARTDIETLTANKFAHADYRTVTESSQTKHYLYFYKAATDAPSNLSTLPTNYLCRVDVAAFVKDGMVSDVTVSGGNLVITWNSDSTGVTTPTTIPLTAIFNPANYYDKDAVDSLIEGVEAGQIGIVDTLDSDETGKALSAKQGKVLNTNKAEKSELGISAVSGSSDKKNIQLKSGVSVDVLTAHQDISGKADKSATVSNVSYDSTTRKIQKTINGSTSDVVTLAPVATSGSYNDLDNKPTIPTVPTNVSAFTNDAGYQTSSQVTSAINSAVSATYTTSTETLAFTLPAFTAN